ncbi:hypothetical protein Adt_11023 [Abeliophyllum distichum]|uniref:Uncharacterized protein n=1 Tax=Abeliophyllum distichum TaxID=126358 RepID=A0ABD1ULQ6_9LAMI
MGEMGLREISSTWSEIRAANSCRQPNFSVNGAKWRNGLARNPSKGLKSGHETVDYANSQRQTLNSCRRLAINEGTGVYMEASRVVVNGASWLERSGAVDIGGA